MNHMVTLPDGTKVPAIGQGTWFLGEKKSTFEQEREALIAELYGKVAPEDVVDPSVKLDEEGNIVEEEVETDVAEGVEGSLEQIAETDEKIAQTDVDITENEDKTSIDNVEG